MPETDPAKWEVYLDSKNPEHPSSVFPRKISLIIRRCGGGPCFGGQQPEPTTDSGLSMRGWGKFPAKKTSVLNFAHGRRLVQPLVWENVTEFERFWYGHCLRCKSVHNIQKRKYGWPGMEKKRWLAMQTDSRQS